MTKRNKQTECFEKRNDGARIGWSQYFMNIAKVVASRSTCGRKHVGAVIVRDKTILSTGYNGSIRGLAHCDEEGCLVENNHCVRTVHAEANAIAQAAKHGIAIDRAEIYVTASPCFDCFKLIANSGIKRIYFGEFYRDQKIFDFAAKAGIELVDMSRFDDPREIDAAAAEAANAGKKNAAQKSASEKTGKRLKK
jgi:dCMP deaminase